MTSTPIDPARPDKIATIDALTGIRAIAALWVVIEHFDEELYGLFPSAERLAPWVDSGYLGVEVFFVLSGFIISYNYAERFASFDRSRYRGFLVNRMARIYPLHLVTLLVVAVLVGAASLLGTPIDETEKYNPVSFLGNVLMLQALPDVLAWNGPSWSLSMEAAAYLVFPVVALGLVRLGARSAALIAVGWLVAGTAVMLAWLTVDMSATSLVMMVLRIIVEFTAGCLLWKAWSASGEPRSTAFDLVAALAVVATLVGLIWVGESEALGLGLTPLLAVFVLACGGAAGPVRWLLSTRVMRWGGRISYSLYMVHFIVVLSVGKVFPPETFASASLPVRAALLASYYGVTVVAAWICYEQVEKRGKRLVHRLADRRVPAERA